VHATHKTGNVSKPKAAEHCHTAAQAGRLQVPHIDAIHLQVHAKHKTVNVSKPKAAEHQHLNTAQACSRCLGWCSCLFALADQGLLNTAGMTNACQIRLIQSTADHNHTAVIPPSKQLLENR
jgi:hypothetical protein